MRPSVPVTYPHSEEVLELLERGSKGYDWPKFGHDAEMKSLAYHARLRDGLSEDGPSEFQVREILNELKRQFAPAAWSIPDDFLQYTHFERVVQGLDMTSSPGYPYMRRATTNKVFFQQDGQGKFPQSRLQEIWFLVEERLSSRGSDPIRLFIKPEPHKREKCEQKRYRLISSVSVIDQIIDSMLFGEMNRRVIEECVDLPCKGGWSPFVGGWKAVPRQGVMSLDKKGWDWSAHLWLFEIELRLRAQLCRNITEKWLSLASWRYKELFVNPTFVTSGGMLFKQRKPGVMKSGCFNTLVTNSIMQLIIHLRVCLEMGIEPGWLWALGDDTLQKLLQGEQLQDYLRLAANYCHVKHCVEGAEFAGMRFLGEQVEPLYGGKHSFQLKHMPVKFAHDIADAYALLYHRSRKITSLLHLLGDKVRATPEFRDVVWDQW